MERTISSETAFSGQLLDVTVDIVETSDGTKSRREIVHHPGGVVVLPLKDRESTAEVVLVGQYRKTVEQFVWELPAGTLESGERPLDCAKRELEEETGFRGEFWDRKVDLFTSPGYSDEVLTLYTATELDKVPPSKQATSPEDEKIEIRSFAQDRIYELAASGKIQDGKTLAGLLYLILLDNRDSYSE